MPSGVVAKLHDYFFDFLPCKTVQVCSALDPPLFQCLNSRLEGHTIRRIPRRWQKFRKTVFEDGIPGVDAFADW